jgi:hypothetical protein
MKKFIFLIAVLVFVGNEIKNIGEGTIKAHNSAVAEAVENI